LWTNHPEKLGYWGSLIVLSFFSVVIVIDIEYKLILHPVSIFGAVLGLLVGIYLHGFIPSLLGGVVGFGTMLVLYWLGGVLLRFTARRRGEEIDDVALGFGDVNLSGVIGLMLGFPAVILGLFLAILIGGAVSLLYLVVMLVLGRYRLFSALPYGPFLVAGAVLLLFFKDFLSVIFS
jgi:leader peptidase (prepilin peptidase)/N-methyltransferase